MQLGKVHLPCTRIHHAEIASVQISQGEYYFSGRYKDFFPEGERSFFVGGKLGERHVTEPFFRRIAGKMVFLGSGGDYVKGSDLRKRWNWEIHSNFESGGSICYNGEKSHSDRL